MKTDEKYDWKQLTPLFWSEISSSFMVHNIFERHKEIARDFLHEILGLDEVRINLEKLQVKREKNYPGKGHIDVYLSVEDDFCVLIEVKVHDYASARPDQLVTYYQAALANRKAEQFQDVYLIYITQFTKSNFGEEAGYLPPPSISEFSDTQVHLHDFAAKMRHISWDEFHSFIGDRYSVLSKEEQLIMRLHMGWIEEKNKHDKENRRVINGERGLEYYFNDVGIDLAEKLTFGRKAGNSLIVSLRDLTLQQRNQLLEIIGQYTDSRSISRTKAEKKDYAIQAAKGLVTRLAINEADWNLLSFYSSLFSLIDLKEYLQLEGTGTKGFSIMVTIEGKGKLSLCTIWTNKHRIEFKIKR
jgi:hypothetical protein